MSATTGFITRNEDVFKLSGAGAAVVHSTNLRVVERRNTDDFPIGMEVEMRAVEAPSSPSSSIWPFRRAQPVRAAAPDTVEIEWNRVSKKRQERGDLVDFDLTITRDRAMAAGDLLILRFPIEPEAINDPDFALTVAASHQPYVAGSIAGAELGVGSELGLHFALAFVGRTHMATGYRFAALPKSPYLELRLHLNPTVAQTKVRIARLFAGYDYDPYVFNPEYEYRAHLKGRPEFPGGAEVLAEFERQARAACRTHRYSGMQSFIKPFLVLREGRPSFPMLIGTPNSISWYSIDPFHGIEQFEDEGWLHRGDVSLDCGAHAGQMSTLFGLFGGKEGKVFSFDPFPQNYLQVEAQARLNGLDNLKSERAGVGPAKSTLNLSILGQMTTETAHGSAQNDRIDMNIVPLDDYIDAKPTFIKLDVEGAEVGALHGAQKLMERHRPRIFTELHLTLIGEFGHTVKDFFDAIPQSLYRVHYSLGGAWTEYQAGHHERFSGNGALVFATPR